jgi:hypothetical protein
MSPCRFFATRMSNCGPTTRAMSRLWRAARWFASSAESQREEQLMDELAAAGIEKIPGYVLQTFGKAAGQRLRPGDGEARWPVLMREDLARLRGAGWQVEFSADFRHRVLEVEAWDADLVESEDGWFSLDMGVIVEGERLPLAPLLASLFRRDGRWLDAALLAQIDDAEMIELVTPSCQRIRAPAWRLKPLAGTLIDLFDGFSGGNSLASVAFRRAASGRTQRQQSLAVQGTGRCPGACRAADGRAGNQPHRSPGLASGSNCATTRPRDWPGCSSCANRTSQGILADDMGLGKTAQTLAHLLLEKEAGRLDRPALIVLPTSLIFNWKNEAARFAPACRSFRCMVRSASAVLPRSPARRGADHLPAALARCRRADPAQLSPADSRRSADGQERAQPGR